VTTELPAELSQLLDDGEAAVEASDGEAVLSHLTEDFTWTPSDDRGPHHGEGHRPADSSRESPPEGGRHFERPLARSLRSYGTTTTSAFSINQAPPRSTSPRQPSERWQGGLVSDDEECQSSRLRVQPMS
jgi:hypothetical protein